MYADIYVIKKTRSKDYALKFLDTFLPQRKENTHYYAIYAPSSNEPKHVFKKVENLMIYLERNPNTYQSIYWNGTDKSNLNTHAMLFYTIDGYIIFGISRHSNYKEEEGLAEMKSFLESDKGYILGECPPPNSYSEFYEEMKIVEKERQKWKEENAK